MTAPSPAGDSSVAWNLIAEERFEEAREWFRVRVAATPDARLYAGLAHACMKLEQWEEMLSALDQAERLAGGTQPEWLAMRGHAHGRLRQRPEAERAFRELLALRPDLPAVRYQVADAVLADGKHEEAVEILDAPAARADARCSRLAMDCLSALWKFGDARNRFNEAIDASQDARDIAELLTSAGRVFGKHDRLRAAMQRAHARLVAIGKPAPVLLVCRLLYGMGDIDALRREMDRPGRKPFPPVLERCARAALGEVSGARKVFNIGLSRTGTTSLNTALSMLGVAALHWTNPFTTQMLDDADVPLFEAQTDGWPSARFEEIAAAYPDALFIYTHREASAWHKSYLKHAHGRFAVRTIDELKAHLQDKSRPCPYGESWRRLHLDLYGPFDSFLEAHAAHHRRVTEFFADKPHRLLPLPVDAPDPWGALCGFLGKPIPEQPYPHRNRGG